MILCGGCEVLDELLWILSKSLKFLLHDSSGFCRSLAFAIVVCSFGGTVLECTTVDLHNHKKLM